MLDSNRKLYLSYESSDRAVVRRIEEALRARRIPVTSDEDISPGTEWRNDLKTAWHAAGAFAVFLSRPYALSQFSMIELGAALGSDSPVIAVQLADAPLPADLGLSHAIDGRGLSPEQIADAIKSALDREPMAISA